ncbi:hypothetical protein ACWC9T_13770 [Kitasatospora sp. NPDC001159]
MLDTAGGIGEAPPGLAAFGLGLRQTVELDRDRVLLSDRAVHPDALYRDPAV